MKTSVKQTVNVFYNKATSQIGNNVRTRVFNAGLLARSQFASERSCDRPTRSRFSVVFLGPRANAELVPKFHVALHASHAAVCCENYAEHTSPVRTSQETHYVTTTETNQLMLFIETAAVHH
jgi:hypothetical protein